MKILWLIPSIIKRKSDPIKQSDFMIYEKNEIAKSLKNLRQSVDTVVGYHDDKAELDGYSNVNYFRIRQPKYLYLLFYHLYMLFYLFTKKHDVIFFNYHSIHLVPFAWLVLRMRGRTKLILDIRTVPVDLDQSISCRIELLRYQMALFLANWFCEGITCITPMLGDDVKKYLRNDKLKIGYFQTGVNFKIFDPNQSVSLRSNLSLNDKFIIIYHGVLSPNRGLQNVILALKTLRNNINNLTFMVVGTGDGESELKKLTKENNLENNVLFVGPVHINEIPNYIKTADAGIIPLPKIDWWNVSSPIKLKEYLAMELPIIATDIPAHRLVIEKTGGATLIKDSSIQSISNSIEKIYVSKKTEYPRVSRTELYDNISYRSQAIRIIDFINSINV